MTSSERHSESHPDRAAGARQLRGGIKMLFVSLVIVVISLGLFVYALGMPQSTDDPPQVKQIPLALSMIGFGASSLLFWLAFLQLAKTR